MSFAVHKQPHPLPRGIALCAGRGAPINEFPTAAEQHRLNREHAARHGYDLADTFTATDPFVPLVDMPHTSHNERIAFDALLRAAQTGAPFGRIFVTDALRLARWVESPQGRSEAPVQRSRSELINRRSGPQKP